MSLCRYLAREDTQILLAYDEDSQPVATGLLFKTGDVAGIHQIGVPADHQGKGLRDTNDALSHSMRPEMAGRLCRSASVSSGKAGVSKIGLC